MAQSQRSQAAGEGCRHHDAEPTEELRSDGRVGGGRAGAALAGHEGSQERGRLRQRLGGGGGRPRQRGISRGGECVSDQVGEVAVQMNAGSRDGGSSLAKPSCGGRVAVTTAVEPTEELRSTGRMGGRPSRSCSGGARRLAGAGGDCVSEEVGAVAVRMNGRISRRGEQVGGVQQSPSCGGRCRHRCG